jgi:glycogen synthase
MRILILTNEYPPHVYGGAGVHVEYLSQELSRLEGQSHSVRILCFGEQRKKEGNLTVEGVSSESVPPLQESGYHKLLDTLVRNVSITALYRESDVLHCHTWYTHFAGSLIKELFGAPLVITTHSLEPQRPWKMEQLGSAYKISEWLERTAYGRADGVIAVSRFMKDSVQRLYGVPAEKIRVIPNGIDSNQFRPAPNPALLSSYGIDPELPFVLFVGRISRQKGIIHLVEAIRYLPPKVQAVLLAGMPDTEEIGREMEKRIGEARAHSAVRIIWIPQILPKDHLISFYTHASVFACPSIYEPFGIINLEAMACETPVVAAAVGGIPEVVVHQETGVLLPFEPVSPANPEPKDPGKFSQDLAQSISRLLLSAQTRREMGIQARRRVEQVFSWERIALQTLDFYREIKERAKEFIRQENGNGFS